MIRQNLCFFVEKKCWGPVGMGGRAVTLFSWSCHHSLLQCHSFPLPSCKAVDGVRSFWDFFIYSELRQQVYVERERGDWSLVSKCLDLFNVGMSLYLRANKTRDLMKPLHWKKSEILRRKKILFQGGHSEDSCPHLPASFPALCELGIVFVYMAFLPTLQGLHWYKDCRKQSCLNRGVGRVCTWYDHLSPQPISMARW